MSSSLLRWGILSTARILRRFVPALRLAHKSELVAVASRDPDRASACAQRYGIPRAHSSYQALLDDDEVDAVYVALPNHLHADWTIKAAEAGKHVLCEKPIALSLNEIDAIMRAARLHQVTVVEAFVHLHHPQMAQLAEVMGQRLGPIRLIKTGFSFRVTDAHNIRLDPLRGGGALWDVGCYPVSLCVALAGGAPMEVNAMEDTGPSGVDLSLVGQLRFESGVLAQIDCGFNTPLRELLEIVGEWGSLSVTAPFRAGIDGTASSYLLRREGEPPQEQSIPVVDPFSCEIAAFEDSVLHGAPPAVPLSRSRDIAATLVALYRAARQHKTVVLASTTVDVESTLRDRRD